MCMRFPPPPQVGEGDREAVEGALRARNVEQVINTRIEARPCLAPLECAPRAPSTVEPVLVPASGRTRGRSPSPTLRAGEER
jgi:hypothetical protein